MSNVEVSVRLSPKEAGKLYMHSIKLEDQNKALREALQALHDDCMDYIAINRLSGAENNQVLVNARAALALARGEE